MGSRTVVDVEADFQQFLASSKARLARMHARINRSRAAAVQFQLATQQFQLRTKTGLDKLEQSGCETKVVVKPISAAMPPPKVSTSRATGLETDQDQFTQSRLNQFQLTRPDDRSDGLELQQLSIGPRKAISVVSQQDFQQEFNEQVERRIKSFQPPPKSVTTILFSGLDFSLEGFHQVSNVKLQSEQHQQVILTSTLCLRSIHKDRHASGFPHPKMGFQLRVWDPGIT